MKKNYIKAVIEMIQAGTEIDSVLSGLFKTLQERGHTRLHVSVLNGVVRMLNGSTKKTSIATITVMNEEKTEKYKHAIDRALEKLNSNRSYIIKTDRTIIGGFIAEHNNKILDNSYKAKLVTLYRTLVK